MKAFRAFVFACFVAITLLTLSLTVFAHPGKTDSRGGHTDRSTGAYHYHHGNPAHQHTDIDGDGVVDCPYNFERTYERSTSNNGHEDSLSNSPVAILMFIGVTMLIMFAGPFVFKRK